jgi:hypothetical protein
VALLINTKQLDFSSLVPAALESNLSELTKIECVRALLYKELSSYKTSIGHTRDVGISRLIGEDQIDLHTISTVKDYIKLIQMEAQAISVGQSTTFFHHAYQKKSQMENLLDNVITSCKEYLAASERDLPIILSSAESAKKDCVQQLLKYASEHEKTGSSDAHKERARFVGKMAHQLYLKNPNDFDSLLKFITDKKDVMLRSVEGKRLFKDNTTALNYLNKLENNIKLEKEEKMRRRTTFVEGDEIIKGNFSKKH